MSTASSPLSIPQSTHLHYLRQTIELAKLSPPKPTNFRVGCVIVSYPHASTQTQSPTNGVEQEIHGNVLSTGYTLELAGNTHAEQNALAKLARGQVHLTPGSGAGAGAEEEADLSTLFPPNQGSILVLYTSLEPCSLRLSGNTACVRRIISTLPKSTTANGTSTVEGGPGGIRRVVFGAKEPGTFVQDSQSCRILSEAGVEWEYLPEFEGEILRVAMEGHGKGKDDEGGEKREEDRKVEENKERRIDDITEEERKRQDAQPRNPKKRMMELDPKAG